MKEELTKVERIALVALQGLLASGDYTIPGINPCVKKFAPNLAGHENHPDRHRFHVVIDAFAIAEQFMAKAESAKKVTRKRR